MKIEVTETWVCGNASETSSVCVDMGLTEPIGEDDIAAFVSAIRSTLREAKPKVNVYVDGAKIAVNEAINKAASDEGRCRPS